MTEDDTDNSGLFDDSRRSLMKKGVAGLGATALGLGAAGNAAAQQQSGEVAQAVVPTNDFYGGLSFTVIAQLQPQTVAQILSMGGQQQPQIFDDPYNWNGYAIVITCNGSPLEVSYLFSEEISLSAGDSATLGMDAQFRGANFVQVDIVTGGGG